MSVVFSTICDLLLCQQWIKNPLGATGPSIRSNGAIHRSFAILEKWEALPTQWPRVPAAPCSRRPVFPLGTATRGSGKDPAQFQNEPRQYRLIGDAVRFTEDCRRFDRTINVNLLLQRINQPSQSHAAGGIFFHLLLKVDDSIGL